MFLLNCVPSEGHKSPFDYWKYIKVCPCDASPPNQKESNHEHANEAADGNNSDDGLPTWAERFRRHLSRHFNVVISSFICCGMLKLDGV